MACLALLFVAVACGDTRPEPLDLSGTWVGSIIEEDEEPVALTLNLTHDVPTDRLSGTWGLSLGSVTLTGTTDGQKIDGSVTLTMDFENEPTFGYTGEITDGGTSIVGNFKDTDNLIHPVTLEKR